MGSAELLYTGESAPVTSSIGWGEGGVRVQSEKMRNNLGEGRVISLPLSIISFELSAASVLQAEWQPIVQTGEYEY